MKKIVVRLIKINIIFYINNFLYAFIKTKFDISGLISLWAFSPYFILLFSGIVVDASIRKELSGIRKKAIFDLLLRTVAMFINFYATTFNFGAVAFNLLILAELMVMTINLYLEISIYKYVKEFIDKNKVLEQKILSEEEIKNILEDYYLKDKVMFSNLETEERKNLDNIFKVNAISGFSMVCLSILFIWSTLIVRIAGERYRFVFFIFLLCILAGYIYNRY